jgi:hypothetical protein
VNARGGWSFIAFVPSIPRSEPKLAAARAAVKPERVGSGRTPAELLVEAVSEARRRPCPIIVRHCVARPDVLIDRR